MESRHPLADKVGAGVLLCRADGGDETELIAAFRAHISASRRGYPYDGDEIQPRHIVIGSPLYVSLAGHKRFPRQGVENPIG